MISARADPNIGDLVQREHPQNWSDRPQGLFTRFGKFQMAISLLCNAPSDSLRVWF